MKEDNALSHCLGQHPKLVGFTLLLSCFQMALCEGITRQFLLTKLDGVE